MRQILWTWALALALAAGLLACGPRTQGPIPGEDPIVGNWAGQLGATSFTSQGVFVPDPHFADGCADVPQVREETQKCATGSWQALGDGSYAIVVPRFTVQGADGAHDCQCNGAVQVLGRVHGNSLVLGGGGGPTITLDRR